MKNRVAHICLITCVLFASGCYLVKQAKGQFEVCFRQVPLEKAVIQENNPKFRFLLKSIPKIKKFASERLFLKKTDSYSDYFATQKEGITFVVTASPKKRLEAYTWNFPFLGDVPYKGFFDKRDALDLAKELRDKGYDTWIFSAVAYSSLGWLDDPITTPMLRNGYYSLAETIIHEMTHSKFYVKGQGDFNEQLASFTGKKGAFQYFAENKIFVEEQLQKINDRLEKRVQTAEVARKYIPKLESLYRKNYSSPIILKKREVVFAEITKEILKIYPRADPEYWRFNNARILQYKRYKSQNTIFEDFWEKSGEEWNGFWMLIKQHADKQKWSIVSY